MRLGLSTYYLRSPFRSHYFVAPSLMLLADFFLLGTILAKNWNKLPAWSIYLLGFVALLLISAWIAILGTHKVVRRYLQSAHIETLEAQSPLETGLYVAAYMSQCLSIYTFAAVGFSLAALGELFIGLH